MLSQKPKLKKNVAALSGLYNNYNIINSKLNIAIGIMRRKYFLGAMFVVFVSLFSLHVQGIEKVEVNTALVKSVLGEGDSVSSKIIITNHGKLQEFTISSSAGFVFLDKNKLILDNGEAGVFSVLVDSYGYRTGVYTGKIIITGEKEEIILPAILEVETSFPLFDVLIEESQSFLGVAPGGILPVSADVYRLKGERDSVTLEYYVKDIDGNIIFEDIEILNVSKHAKITKKIPIPSDALGDYVFSVSAIEKNSLSTGTGSFLFSVFPALYPDISQKNYYPHYILISFFVVIILIISFVLFNRHWNKNLVENAKHWRKEIGDIKKIKFSDINKKINKLEYQKTLLKKAYEKKYIKRKSFDEGVVEINALIIRLKKRL